MLLIWLYTISTVLKEFYSFASTENLLTGFNMKSNNSIQRFETVLKNMVNDDLVSCTGLKLSLSLPLLIDLKLLFLNVKKKH